MPIPTKPLELGAPLPTDDYPGPIEFHLPSEDDLRAEWLRAKVELMHAIARHRKAWSRMRSHKLAAEMKAVWAEGYTPYKEAVSDVRWWREEMSAQAATVTALTALLSVQPE
jgi:hypothetical protein